jgi:hypothetical protein
MLRVKLFTNFTTLREVSVITNYRSPERHLLEEVAESPDKRDSLLNAQEKQKNLEEEKLKAEQEKEEKEKAESERIKAELERQWAESSANQATENEITDHADTIK